MEDLRISIDEGDPEASDAAARQLIAAIRDAEVADHVGHATEDAPEGAKSGIAAIVGSVSASLAAGAVAPAMVILHDWVKRRKRYCTVSVEVRGATLEFPAMTLREALAMLEEEGVLTSDITLPDG